MTEKTRTEQIDKILMGLAVYYDKKLPEAVVEIYHQLWAEHPVEVISQACRIWMQKGKFFPKVSEINEIIEQYRAPQIKIEARAQAEWRKVIIAVRQCGQAKGPPGFKDPITQELIHSQFNWEHLCTMEVEKEVWWEKRWMESFAYASEHQEMLKQIEAKEKIKQLVAPIGAIENDSGKRRN